MSKKESITNILYEIIDQTNQTLPADKKHLKKALDTPLFGESAVLDSLGLVNFIVSTETALQEKFKIPIVLADERAMSQNSSPFRTIGTLADYIATLLDEKKRK
jgi:acyl carrier protein